MATSNSSNKPIKVFRSKGISTSVFENETEDGKNRFHKVTIQRTYKQGDSFKTTNSFSRDELPIATLLMQKTWEFLVAGEAEGSSDDGKE